VALTAKFLKTLIMAIKWKSYDLNRKLELICPCEVSSSSRSEIGRQYGLTSSTLFIILKKRQYCMSTMKQYISYL
jgi:hypothetical protein